MCSDEVPWTYRSNENPKSQSQSSGRFPICHICTYPHAARVDESKLRIRWFPSSADFLGLFKQDVGLLPEPADVDDGFDGFWDPFGEVGDVALEREDFVLSEEASLLGSAGESVDDVSSSSEGLGDW
ncbi:hypothetical protein FRB94_011274 [Tulasnella sp. JGI-2019a]|nr:hypothetical protein FRB94_011274 [Tulasnella sp. JGI-2019a]